MEAKCDDPEEKSQGFTEVSSGKRDFQFVKHESDDLIDNVGSDCVLYSSQNAVFFSGVVKCEDLNEDALDRFVNVPHSVILFSRSAKYEDAHNERVDNCFAFGSRNPISHLSSVEHKVTPNEPNFPNVNDLSLNAGNIPPVSPPKDRLFCCDTCDRKFKRKSHLIVHWRIHTGEKPYKCDKCNTAFAYRAVLRHHELIHSGEKPFKCKFCPSEFTKKFNLKSHVSRKHLKGLIVEPKERKFVCNICKSKFFRLSALKVHERKHSSVAPYRCNFCKKGFKYKHVLKKHSKTHDEKCSLFF